LLSFIFLYLKIKESIDDLRLKLKEVNKKKNFPHIELRVKKQFGKAVAENFLAIQKKIKPVI